MSEDDEWSTGTGGEDEQAQDRANKTAFAADIEKYRVVVVGGGLAAAKICESLVEEYEKQDGSPDCRNEVCVVTTELMPPYHHSSLLTTDLIKNAPTSTLVQTPEEGFYQKHGIVLKTNAAVSMFQPEEQSITITSLEDSSSKVVFYTSVIFATGMKFRPATGRMAELGSFYTVNSHVDVDKLRGLLSKNKTRILVIGNTLDAVQAACSLSSWIEGTNGHVTIVSEKKRLCDTVLSTKDSKFLQQQLVALSNDRIRLKLGVKVTTIYGFEMTLSNTDSLTFDFGVVFNGQMLNSDELYRHKLPLAPVPALGIRVDKQFRARGTENVFIGGALAAQELQVNKYFRITTEENVVLSSPTIAHNALLLEREHEEYSIIPRTSKTLLLPGEDDWKRIRVDHFGNVSQYRSCKGFGTQEMSSTFGSIWVNKGLVVALTVWNAGEGVSKKAMELLESEYDKSIDYAAFFT